MSTTIGPLQPTSGLVFAYDADNTNKSYFGGPMTNYYYNNGSPFDPWTVGGTNTDVSNTADAGPVTDSKTWKFVKSGTSNQWNGWEGSYGSIWTGSAGDVWTTSYWYKTTAPAGITNFGIGAFYTPDWARAYSYSILANRSSIIADGTWRWNYTVTQINEAYSNAIIVDGPSWGYSSSPGTLFINGLQWNKNSYPGSHVSGSRSTTQTLYDLTRRNAITATSLTYATDGTFSFSTNNSMSVAASNDWAFGQNGTVEAWIYPTSNSGTNNRLWCVTNNSSALDAYFNGGSTAVYMHGGTVGTTTSVSLNTWTHVVVTYTAGTVAVYFNGVSQPLTGTTTGYNITNNNPLLIGNYQAGTGYNFNGKIQSVRVYNRPLTSTEIGYNFHAYRSRYGI